MGGQARTSQEPRHGEPVRQPAEQALRQPEPGVAAAPAVAPQAAYRRAQNGRGGLRPADLVALQRALGNRAVQRIVGSQQRHTQQPGVRVVVAGPNEPEAEAQPESAPQVQLLPAQPPPFGPPGGRPVSGWVQRQPQQQASQICPSGHKIGENIEPPLDLGNGNLGVYAIWGAWQAGDTDRTWSARALAAWVPWRFGAMPAERQKQTLDYLLSVKLEPLEDITPQAGCQYGIVLTTRDYYRTRVKAGEAGAQPRAGRPGAGKRPVALVNLEQNYAYMLKHFPGHEVFTKLGATVDDLAIFAGNRPAAYKALPALPKDRNQPPTDQRPWLDFLEQWQPFLEALRRRGGALGGEPGGALEGIQRFDASAELIVPNEQEKAINGEVKYVKGSDISFLVKFDRTSDDNYFMNFHPFVNRAIFDWTIYHEGKKYDSGPLFERGARDYSLSLNRTGTYSAKVSIASPYFKNSPLEKEKGGIVVVEEKARAAEVFGARLADAKDPDAPFERDASGRLKLKAGKALAPEEEIRKIDIEIGITRGLAGKPDFSQEQANIYIKYLEDQKKALEELLSAQKQPEFERYVVYGTYLSRENSQHFEIKAYMYRKTRKTTAIRAYYRVKLLDATLDPGNPTHHEGEGVLEHWSRIGWEQQGWVTVEQRAIDKMAEHLRKHNDYPDGTVTLGIKRLEDGQVVQVGPIDTHSGLKTAKKVLGITALVAGLVALAASPFTGGTSASVGLVLIKGVATAAAVTGAVAGVGATLLELQDRYEKEHGLKVDRRLVLDILSIVGAIMGAGGFLRALREAGNVGKLLYLSSNVSLDVASGVLMTAAVREDIARVEAMYGRRLADETEPEKKAALVRERDSAIAQLIGQAAVNDSFILVSLAGGIHQIVSIRGVKTRTQYSVRQEIVELVERNKSNPERLRELLNDPRLLPHERAYLQEALLAPGDASYAAWKEKQVSGETAKLLDSDPALAAEYKKMDPEVRRLVTHCSPIPCVPKKISEHAQGVIKELLERTGVKGDDQGLREYLYDLRDRRNVLQDSAVEGFEKIYTKKQLEDFLEAQIAGTARKGGVATKVGGRWTFTRKQGGPPIVEYTIGPHRELTKGGTVSFLESHHGVQDKWGETVLKDLGYNREDAPAILLRGPSTSATPHQTVNARQTARGRNFAARTLSDEYLNTQNDFAAAGVPPEYTDAYLKACDKYYGQLYKNGQDKLRQAGKADAEIEKELQKLFGTWKPKS